MTFNTYKATQQIRSQILRAVELLINHPNTTEAEQANQTLASLWSKFSEKEQIYSLESLVFNIFVQDIKNSGTQSHRDELIRLRDELSGTASHWHSYAIRNDFTKSMTDSIMKTHNILQVAFAEYKRVLLKNALDENLDIIGELLEELHSSCYQNQPANFLVDLLVFQACHTLLTLPVPPQKSVNIYNSESRWGSFGNGSAIVNVEDQINYIGDILQKIKGELVVFVDIHMLSEGFVFSVR